MSFCDAELYTCFSDAILNLFRDRVFAVASWHQRTVMRQRIRDLGVNSKYKTATNRTTRMYRRDKGPRRKEVMVSLIDARESLTVPIHGRRYFESRAPRRREIGSREEYISRRLKRGWLSRGRYRRFVRYTSFVIHRRSVYPPRALPRVLSPSTRALISL